MSVCSLCWLGCRKFLQISKTFLNILADPSSVAAWIASSLSRIYYYYYYFLSHGGRFQPEIEVYGCSPQILPFTEYLHYQRNADELLGFILIFSMYVRWYKPQCPNNNKTESLTWHFRSGVGCIFFLNFSIYFILILWSPGKIKEGVFCCVVINDGNFWWCYYYYHYFSFTYIITGVFNMEINDNNPLQCSRTLQFLFFFL